MNTIITETTEVGEVPVDIYSRLSDDRILFISDFISDEVAVDITASLLLKNAEDPDEEISLVINAEGGDIRNCFMIYDMMQILQCDVKTICIGAAMNEVSLLLAAGTPGKRFATQNAVICISQLIQEKYYRATLSDAKSIQKRIEADSHNFMKALAKKTGRKINDVKTKFKDKVFMNATEAAAYGIIDEVIAPK